MNALFQSENRALIVRRSVSSILNSRTEHPPAIDHGGGYFGGAADEDRSRPIDPGSTQPLNQQHSQASAQVTAQPTARPNLSTIQPPQGAEVRLESWQQLVLCSTEAARSYLPFEIARRYCALPLAVIGEQGHHPLISMLVPEEPDAETLKSLRFACGLGVIIDTAPRILIEKALSVAYLSGDNELLFRFDRAKSTINSRDQEPLWSENCSAAVPELLSAILNRAIVARASDIHIEPINEFRLRKYSVRFRIDGRLTPQVQLEPGMELTAAIFRRIKILAGLEISGLRTPQEGALTFPLGVGQSREAIRMRVSFVPVIDGEKAVLRILENSVLDAIISTGSSSNGDFASGSDEGPSGGALFLRLGMTFEQKRLFCFCLAGDRGAVLLSGPTGSGKSTLLSAALQTLRCPAKTVVAIEDPVERRLADVTHLEVDRVRGLDYQQLLVAVLRQDPDVLMLGEIRESATARTALDAALTGKLVLSTIHAASVFEVIFRLIEMGISPELLSVSMRAVSSQRLAPLACPTCKVMHAPGPGLRRIFGLNGSAEVARSPGCESCGFTGSAGRIGIFEILPVSERIRDAICGASADRLRSASQLRRLIQCTAADEGFEPLVVGIRRRLLDGSISSDAALAAAGLSSQFFN